MVISVVASGSVNVSQALCFFEFSHNLSDVMCPSCDELCAKMNEATGFLKLLSPGGEDPSVPEVG